MNISDGELMQGVLERDGYEIVDTPEAARQWVQQAAAQGIDGLKLGAMRPEIMHALLLESKRH